MSDVTYARYLQLDRGLSAQTQLSSAHDETLSITILRTKRLWLTQVFAELRLAKGIARRGAFPRHGR